MDPGLMGSVPSWGSLLSPHKHAARPGPEHLQGGCLQAEASDLDWPRQRLDLGPPGLQNYEK